MTDDRPSDRPRRIAFLSSNSGWGGSEELWSAAAAVLARRGVTVTVGKAGVDRKVCRVADLAELGVPLTDLRRLSLIPQRLTALLVFFSWPFDYLIRAMRLRGFLRRSRAELTVLSQGGNLDGLFYAKRLRRRGVPYVLVVQKAAEMYWPSDDQLADLQAMYGEARQVCFVSQHNLTLTEAQLARPLPNGVVVRNPFLVPFDSPQPWPASETRLRLACVGRLFPREKGQDIVLRVLAREKWRERAIEVTFFGAGQHAEALRQNAVYLRLENVRFHGFATDVAAIWRDHHGLLLPSHCEGLPLVLVEAMLSGRVAIVTDVAGNAEVLTDNVSGFLAAAPTDDSVDEALERAWQARARWPQIGEEAARQIRTLVPPSPEVDFADRLLSLLDEREAGNGE